MPKHVPRSKLRPPRSGPDRLERQRLLDLLDQSLGANFTLVAAPAGYGKTTLLAQWAKRQTLPVAWLALDETDNDATLFLEELVAAVRTVSPDSCQGAATLLARPGLPPLDILCRELTNDLEDLDDLILVLDDSHVLKDPGSLEVLRHLVSRPPVSLQLVLSGRADPPLPLGALRGSGRLYEVRAAQLRFNEEETVRYFEQTLGRSLGRSQVASLIDRTEGWIAGLHLAALSLAQRPDVEEGIRELAGSDRYIADYLMEELLSRLEPGLQRYLMATSLLDRLCAPLCAAVVGEEGPTTIDGRPVLEWLEEANLFVVSLDDHREWFRYHHLFRDLLRHWLSITSGEEEVAGLHIRAGEWLGGKQQVEEGISHFLKAARPDLAADLVEENRREAIDQEQWRVVERWVSKLQPELVDSRPGLVMIHAWLAQQRGDGPHMYLHCDRVERLLDSQTLPEVDDDTLRGEIAAVRAQAGFWDGKGEQAVTHAREALDRLPLDYRLPRGTAVLVEGGGLHLMGKNQEAFEVLTRGSFGEYGTGIHPRVMIGLALLALTRGELDHAGHVANLLLSQASDQALEDSVGWAHYFLGFGAYLRNDLAGAENHFQSIDAYVSHVTPAKQSYYALAWVRYGQARPDEALEVMDDHMALITDLELPMRSESRLLRARLSALSGRPADELLLARGLIPSATDGPVFLRLCHELSPLTAVHLLLLEGSRQDLSACDDGIRNLLASAEASGNIFRQIQCLILQALLLDRRSENPEALASLGHAVNLAKSGRLVRLFPEMGDRVCALLQALRARGHEDPFVDEVVASFSGNGRAFDAIPTRPLPSAGQDYLADSLVTNREIDVLELLAERLSNKEIARRLVISPATVKRHTLSIYRKLGVQSRREAVAKARRLGLLPDLS